MTDKESMPMHTRRVDLIYLRKFGVVKKLLNTV